MDMKCGRDVLVGKVAGFAVESFHHEAGPPAVGPFLLGVKACGREGKAGDYFFDTVVFPEEGEPVRKMFFTRSVIRGETDSHRLPPAVPA